MTDVLDPTAGALTSGRLLVDFCGEEHLLTEHDRFTIGRRADLCVDDNPYLHRRLCLIEQRVGRWWLHNIGARIPLVVRDLTSRSQVTLAPNRELALSFPNATVHFSAGRSNYEIGLTVLAPVLRDVDVDHGFGDDDTNATISLADLPLTDDQRRLIVVLAEPALRTGGTDIVLPANKEAAARLGWTITRFNRKLDNVCDRLTKAGVSGLRGHIGETAADRRVRLVDHAVQCGLVTYDDLALLD